MLIEKLGVSGDDHIFIAHQSKSLTFDGVVQKSVQPNGASGGVVIDLGIPRPELLRPGAPCSGLLAGLLLERHRSDEAIVAVKIGLVVRSIRQHYMYNQ